MQWINFRDDASESEQLNPRTNPLRAQACGALVIEKASVSPYVWYPTDLSSLGTVAAGGSLIPPLRSPER